MTLAEHEAADALATYYHAVMGQALADGERQGIFRVKVPLRGDADRRTLDALNDPVTWLAHRGSEHEAVVVLLRGMIQLTLGDFLLFVGASLRNAREERLTVALALARKPLQEALTIFEHLVTDVEGFLDKWSQDPSGLQPRSTPNLLGHRQRVQAVLDLTDAAGFDASFLAQLRFDKGSDDSMELLWHRSLHLITTHSRLRTERWDFNFIGAIAGEAHRNNERYYYARVPYLLGYATHLMEHVFAAFCDQTHPEYLRQLRRRECAGIVRWWARLRPTHRTPEIDLWATAARTEMEAHGVDVEDDEGLLAVFAGSG